MQVSVGILDFYYVRWTKNLNLVEPLVMGTRNWNFCVVISKYLDYTQYYMVLLEQCVRIVAKVQATATWLHEDQIHVCLVSWQDYCFCLYVKLFVPSIFKSVDFWSSMSCIVLDIELADKNFIKELGVFFDGRVQGYSFRPPKTYKPTKQSFWCTRILHEIVWNSGRWITVSFQTFLLEL